MKTPRFRSYDKTTTVRVKLLKIRINKMLPLFISASNYLLELTLLNDSIHYFLSPNSCWLSRASFMVTQKSPIHVHPKEPHSCLPKRAPFMFAQKSPIHVHWREPILVHPKKPHSLPPIRALLVWLGCCL